jgi:hypothetical protein
MLERLGTKKEVDLNRTAYQLLCFVDPTVSVGLSERISRPFDDMTKHETYRRVTQKCKCHLSWSVYRGCILNNSNSNSFDTIQNSSQSHSYSFEF